MKQKLQQAIVLILVCLAIIVGVIIVREKEKRSTEKQMLTAIQRMSIIRALRASRKKATSESPEIDAIRKLAEGANVVICVMDAARSDHFASYGY